MALLTPDWHRALSLLDAGLALPAEQREQWLAQMATQEPRVLPLLRKLLAAHGRVQAHEILATLPKVLRGPQTVDSGAEGLHIGPFELLEPLGRGGMGSVWRARYADARLKRDVAVKLPASTDDPVALRNLRERFARERDFLAQLQHPHIARLYDAGVSDNGQPYLAMEYVAGTAIDTYCDAQRLPVKARLHLFLQVLDAVAYAHQQLVLHRDLKAGNVLVDEQGQVRLLDFGVARLLPPQEPVAAGQAPAPALASAAKSNTDAAAPQTDLTERAGAAFTLGYAAPEQISHGALSTATDVYALGVMLYRLLTGLSPYQPPRDSRGALEDAVLLATPAAASSRAFTSDALQDRCSDAQALQRALRGDLDVVLAKALKKSPAERYATVAELADDLRRHLAQQPIRARPDSGWYRSSRFVARNRVAVAASVLAGVALVATAGVAAWQAQVSARNAALATKEAARANTAQKFFAGLLSNADPEKNKNISTVDRRVLDQSLARAEQDFADAPETLSTVLKQMGEIYNNLGEPGRYLQVQKKRVALLAHRTAATADEVVDAQIELGNALGGSELASERAQAAATLIGARDLAFQLGASDATVVLALGRIADQFVAESKYREADRYAAQAVEHAQRTLLGPHPIKSYAFEQRGLTAAKLGHFDLARDAYQQAVLIDATGRGRGKLAQLSTRASLAHTEYSAGNYRASKREALAALDFAQRELGPSKGALAPVRLRAVLASERAGELDEAWRLAEQLLPEDLNSGEQEISGLANFAKGLVALARRRHEIAAQHFETAKPGLALNPRAHRSLAAQMGLLKLQTGRAPEVPALLMPLLERVRAETGTSSEEYSKLAEPLGVALARAGQLAGARSLFDEGCVWRRATLKAEHPSRIRCEAYVILATREGSAADAQRALLHMQVLLEARDDKPMLLSALKAALPLVEALKQGRTTLFPVLD